MSTPKEDRDESDEEEKEKKESEEGVQKKPDKMDESEQEGGREKTGDRWKPVYKDPFYAPMRKG